MLVLHVSKTTLLSSRGTDKSMESCYIPMESFKQFFVGKKQRITMLCLINYDILGRTRIKKYVIQVYKNKMQTCFEKAVLFPVH